MNGWSVIYRRELAGLFLSPLAWILATLALVFDAFAFLYALESFRGEVNTSLSVLLGGWPFWVLVIVLPPLLTMRMISEESRSGVLEFLLTAPVGDAAVVVGKALAASTVVLAILGIAPLYAVLVHALGAPPDWGQVLTAWLGGGLVATLFCAIGILVSASARTPIVAAFLAIVINLLVFAAPFAGAPEGDLGRVIGWFLDKVNVLARYQGSFMTGALDTAHLVFFLAWIVTLWFLAVRVVESRRWLG